MHDRNTLFKSDFFDGHSLHSVSVSKCAYICACAELIAKTLFHELDFFQVVILFYLFVSAMNGSSVIM